MGIVDWVIQKIEGLEGKATLIGGERGTNKNCDSSYSILFYELIPFSGHNMSRD